MTEAIQKMDNGNGQPLVVFGREFAKFQNIARTLSESTMVPDSYRNNLANCFLALDLACRMETSPLAVMQNLYSVKGKIGFEAKFVVAAINASGKYKQNLRYRFDGEGDDYGCRAYTYDLKDEELVGTKITWAMVKAEKWDEPSFNRQTKERIPSKWETMSEQMFKYRAAAFWQREFDPGLTMGILTREEVDDISVDAAEVISPKPNPLEGRLERTQAAPQPTPEPEEPTSPAELSKEKQVLVEIARAFYGESNFMREISKLCRNRGTDFATATDGQCKSMIQEINFEADKAAMG